MISHRMGRTHMKNIINRILCRARLFALAYLTALTITLTLAGCSATDPAWKAALIALNAVRETREVVCSEPVTQAINTVERSIPGADAGIVSTASAKDAAVSEDTDGVDGVDGGVLPVTMLDAETGE